MLVVPDEVLSVTADPMISLVLDDVLGFLLYFLLYGDSEVPKKRKKQIFFWIFDLKSKKY